MIRYQIDFENGLTIFASGFEVSEHKNIKNLYAFNELKTVALIDLNKFNLKHKNTCFLKDRKIISFTLIKIY